MLLRYLYTGKQLEGPTGRRADYRSVRRSIQKSFHRANLHVTWTYTLYTQVQGIQITSASVMVRAIHSVSNQQSAALSKMYQRCYTYGEWNLRIDR